MEKKIKLAAFILSVTVWNTLVLISAIFMGDLARELTYEMYDVSPFISTSVLIVFGILTCFLGVSIIISMFYICFGFSNDKEK